LCFFERQKSSALQREIVLRQTKNQSQEIEKSFGAE
jgi:hypothetical protein